MKKLFICLLLLLTVTAGLFSPSAYAEDTFFLTVDEYCDRLTLFTFNQDITDANINLAEGSMAPGLTYSHDDRTIFVVGTPTMGGIYNLKGMAISGPDALPWEFTLDISDGVMTFEKPTLTKDPTEETTTVGGSVVFIARAEGYTDIRWMFISPEDRKEYTAEETMCQVGTFIHDGIDTETLRISQLPEKLSGWYAECIFTNVAGETKSAPAKITVNKKPPEAPKISLQPSGAETSLGKELTLSVQASGQADATLNYQWYSSASPGISSLSQIMGATSSSYTPPQREGTIYYTVAVWCSSPSGESDKVYSSPAAVIYKPAAPEATPLPSVMPTVIPTAPPARPGQSKDDTGSGLILIIALIMFGAMVGVVYYIIYRRKSMELSAGTVYDNGSAYEDNSDYVIPQSPEPEPRVDSEIWVCSCGAENSGHFCTDCGSPKPEKPVCASCGWAPADPNAPPHFCPNCGAPFGRI